MLKLYSGIQLPKSHPNYEGIANDLVRHVHQFNGGYNEMTFFIERDDYIILPRFYPVLDNIEDTRPSGTDIDIESSITPKNDRQKLCIDRLMSQNSGILQLEPGSGKTVIMIDVISKIGKKAIIFAHKKSLINQWIKEFKDHTNISDDDIGCLTKKKYKECLEKKIIFSTPQILANAYKRGDGEFIRSFMESGIGVLVIDECHVGIGPEQFSKASIFIPAKRTYGLSATPRRSDGNDDLLQYHLGEVINYPPGEDELLKPKVFMVHFPFGIYKRYKQYLTWGKNFNLARYLKQMEKIDSFNKKVAKWITDSYDKGRTTLVMGNNVGPILRIMETVGAPIEDVGIFTPSVKTNDKYKKRAEKLSDTLDLEKAFKEKKIVATTYGACRDGNNRPSLDCLIMITPTSNVEQAIGRVLRTLDGKKIPIVLDLVDTEGPVVPSSKDRTKHVRWFERSAEKRKDFYLSQNWNVEIIELKKKS